MEARKKYTIIVVSLAIALILSLTAMIIVFVIANQNATSAVNVKYTASDVYVELSANAYYGDTTTKFTSNGISGGATSIQLSPDKTTGALSQPDTTTSIELNKNNKTIVFEYIFKNMTDDVNCSIELASYPGMTQGEGIIDNINLTYYYSNTKIDDPLTLTGVSERKVQLLNAYEGETTYKYIYIIASIDELLYNASLEGDFAWRLSRPSDSEITTYTLNISGADYVERDGTTNKTNVDSTATVIKEHTVLEGETVTVDDIDLYPAKANYAFVGWSYTDGGTPIATNYNNSDVITNKVSALTSTTLYPVYKQGTVPADNYSYDGGGGIYRIANTKITTTATEFVIPDYYNDGVNGVAQVAIIDDASSITTNLLYNNTTVTSLTLGRYLVKLGSYSFARHKYISEVNYNCINISDSASELSTNSFQQLGSSTARVTVNFSKSVERVPSYLFRGRRSYISTINFENNSKCKSIGAYAFGGNGSTPAGTLNNVNLPQSLVSIEEGAFCYAPVNPIVIPNNVVSIGNSAFANCTNLATVTLGTKITDIGESAFAGCTALTSISLPSTLKTIANSVFSGCSALRQVTFGEITSIGNEAFKGCSALLSIDIPGSVTSIGNSAFMDCSQFLTFSLQEGLVSIGTNAFQNCSSLLSIYIPSTVTSIGDGAFRYTYRVRSIAVAGNNTVYDSRDNCNAIIRKSNNTLIIACDNTVIPNTVTSIGDYAFEGVVMSQITIPGSVGTIGSYAFAGSSVQSVTIEEGVSYIWDYAFSNCSNLNSINIPSSVCMIVENVLYGVNIGNMTSFTIGGTNSWNYYYITGDLASSNVSVSSVSLTLDSASYYSR